MGTREQIITYWLCLAEPARSHFVSLIRELAARFVLAAHEGTIRILHTLKPLGVAMAGRDIVDPYKD